MSISAEDNISLVYYVYKKYFLSYSYLYDDLISAGMYGLTKALKFYEESYRFKFSTFASRCIYNEMAQVLRAAKYHITNVSLDSKLKDVDGLDISDILAQPDEDLDLRIDLEIALQKLYDAISPVHRKILLYWLQGYKHQEIAPIVGKSRTAVSKYIFTFRQHLQMYLNGGTISCPHRFYKASDVKEQAKREGVSIRTIYRRKAKERLLKSKGGDRH